jgi:hypothetical protein
MAGMFGPGAWCPPRPAQSMAASSVPYWLAGLQHPGMAGSSTQGPWWAPPATGASASREGFDLQAWYVFPIAIVV